MLADIRNVSILSFTCKHVFVKKVAVDIKIICCMHYILSIWIWNTGKQ